MLAAGVGLAPSASADRSHDAKARFLTLSSAKASITPNAARTKGRLTGTFTIKNPTTKAQPATRLRVALRKAKSFKRVHRSYVAIPALARNGSAKVRLNASLPERVAPGKYRLVICIERLIADHCVRPSRRVMMLTPKPAKGTARLSIDSSRHDFGEQPVYGDGARERFTVTNSGTAASGVPQVTLTNPVPLTRALGTGPAAVRDDRDIFTIAESTCTAALPVGASCYVDVTFVPVYDGPVQGSLTVAANPGGKATASLLGNGYWLG